MEPLWSPVVTIGGNQLQIGRPSKPQKQAKSVAARCHRLPREIMVRRGSTVRVRQRALQKRRTSALSRSDRLAQRRSYRGYGAVHGAFKLTHRAPRAQAERLGAVFGCELGGGEAKLDRACQEETEDRDRQLDDRGLDDRNDELAPARGRQGVEPRIDEEERRRRGRGALEPRRPPPCGNRDPP